MRLSKRGQCPICILVKHQQDQHAMGPIGSQTTDFTLQKIPSLANNPNTTNINTAPFDFFQVFIFRDSSRTS
jgi:hypothetical protein